MTHHSCEKGMPARLLAFTTALFMVWGIAFGLLGQAYAEEGQPAPTNPAPTEPAKEEQLLKAQAISIDKITLTDIDVPAVGQKPDRSGTQTIYREGQEPIMILQLSDILDWLKDDKEIDFNTKEGEDLVFELDHKYTVKRASTLSDDYNLSGEITGEVNGKKANLETKADQKTFTLTYDWTLRQVEYLPNEGTGKMDPQPFFQEDGVTLNENKFTREGYAFKGWNTQADGKGTAYTDKQKIDNPTSSLKLYAQWEKIPVKVTVTYDANGGTGTMDAQTADQGSDVTLTKNAFTREGYTFKGWNTDKEGKGGSYSDEQEIKALNQDLTLYAQWEENKAKTATVTFDANGGKGEMDPQTEETGTTVKLNENKFTRSGYTFTGWNTKKDGTGKTFKNKASVKLNSDVTLYAQWKKNSSSNTSSKTSTTTSSKGTLAKTGDQTSFVVVAVLAVIGIVAAVLGLKRRKKSDDNA